jgi:UDP-N-acetylglucosamine--N-acetylmuramyl-(pentapeptide) pyrophosphoryl-undecaprenol N-acetylglucosamine transferase
MSETLNKVVISGGGTGGHIFPAIAIANEIKKRFPECDILFVGAEGKMEMERVPKAGYKIIGLDIRGIQRKLTIKNLAVPFKLMKSLMKAKKIIKDFGPDVAVGVGGYASAPTLKKASSLGVPSLLQEQNSYPGMTNKMLSKKVQKICVAYDGLEQFFPADKIVKTGNPVREEVIQIEGKKMVACTHFGLDPNKKTILVIGGSLGALTLNDSIQNGYAQLEKDDVQVLWQCGKYYAERLTEFAKEHPNKNIVLSPFIDRMDYAYAIADVVISRAGALSVSELCLVGKPSILVPSPNVSEDHQTKNAMALVKNDAAVLIRDIEARETLVEKALDLLKNETELEELSKSILKMAEKDSASRIVDELLKIKK